MTATQALKKAMETECKVYIADTQAEEVHEILMTFAKQITPCSFQLNGYDVWLDTNMAPDGMMEEFVMARKMESDEEVYVKMLDPRDELTAEEWDKVHAIWNAIWKSSSERR